MKPKSFFILSCLLILVIMSCRQKGHSSKEQNPALQQPKLAWALVVHGGAGNIQEEVITGELDARYRASLAGAMQTGKKILQEGGTALDAVEAVIRKLEDNPLFNAGKGAAFTHEGRNELDASIMDGSNLEQEPLPGLPTLKIPLAPPGL